MEFMEIIYQKKRYDYSDYERFINKYFKYFKKGEKIIIQLGHTPNLLFTVYMCFEYDITYIPLDINTPSERVEYVIEKVRPHHIINDNNGEIKISDTGYEGEMLSDLAYIIYTSGTTGNPKGVEINKSALKNFMASIQEQVNFLNCNSIACITTPSFDIFFVESVLPLYLGLTVVLADDSEIENPRNLQNFLSNNNIDMLQVTPSRLYQLLGCNKDLSSLNGIKRVLIGGEKVSNKLLRKLQSIEKLQIYNMYGPTEGTIWTSIKDLTNEFDISIGSPLKNTNIHILNKEMKPVNGEEIGEIYISGDGLANGYYNNVELTNDKFRYIGEMNDIRAYKTGDYGKQLSDGNFKCLGRIDNQVKINGKRVELEEIEERIEEFSFIKRAAVCVIDISEEKQILCSMCESNEIDVSINFDEMKQKLRKKLPEYMIPISFESVLQIPYLLNGKMDRIQISNMMKDTAILSSTDKKKLDKRAESIFNTIKSNLDKRFQQQVTVDEKFFNLGVDSISFIQIIVSLEETYKITFDDDMMLFSEFPTIISMIKYVIKKIDNK